MTKSKTFFLIVLLSLLGMCGHAQQVSVETQIPGAATAGEPFRIEFSVNAKPDTFNPPAIEGLEILAGPTVSKSQSLQIINGSMSKSENYSYTYVLLGSSAGIYSIGAAEMIVDGKSYKSQPGKVEIVGDAQAAHGQSQGSAQQNGQAGQSTEISASDMFVRIIVDRSNVYKGQPVKATFKLYTRLSLSGVESIKMPAFNGFWKQEIDTDNQKWQQEAYNNRVYNAAVIKEVLLYPQQAGTLHIEKFDVTVIAQFVSQNRSQSIFDDFFGGPEVYEVRKNLSAGPVRINVRELPAGAPASFSGAVGTFSLEETLPTTAIAANSAVTYVIKVSGTGNLPLIQAPKLTVPSSFEQYATKTTESLNTNASGIYGYRQFEYPIIARAEGEYTIPAVEFSYFNPDEMKYVTLSTKEFTMEVTPDAASGSSGDSRGIVSGLSKEDIKILGQDIRFIKIGKSGLKPRGEVLIGSLQYFILLAVMLAAFVILLVALRKYLKEMQDMNLVRGKRANRVALQRFRAAERHMNDDNQRGFYEEMLKALWGYMSDKLNIPVANLTKENVREELVKHSVPEEQTEQFISTISDCEQAQYSPMASAQMHETYSAGVDIISKLESSIKK